MGPLDTALDRLDAAFACVPRAFEVTGCGRCYSPAELASLTGPPDLVTDDLVVQVVREVGSHWSDFPGLLHRLAPRILRLLVHGGLPGDEVRVADQLVAAGWTSWPGEQRDATEDLFATWWRSSLERYPGDVPVRDVVGCLVVISGQLRPWLRVIEETPGISAGLHLLDLLDWWVDPLVVGDALVVGDESGHDVTAEVADWLMTDALDVLARVPDTGRVGKAADGLADLEYFRAVRGR